MPATVAEAPRDDRKSQGDGARRRSRVKSIFLPALLVVIWFAAAGIGGSYFGRIDEVSSNDQASFLPASADATLVGERFIDFVGDSQIPGIVIVTSDTPLDDPTLQELTGALAALTNIDGVDGTSPLLPSEDGLAAQSFIPLSTDSDIGDVVSSVRDATRRTPG